MSKTKEQPQKEQSGQAQEYDLTEYAYKEGDVIEIPAKDFVGLIHFLQNVCAEGEQISFKHMSAVESQEEFFSQRVPEMTISPLAFTGAYFLMGMRSIHFENIKEGKAIKLGEFKKAEKDESANFS